MFLCVSKERYIGPRYLQIAGGATYRGKNQFALPSTHHIRHRRGQRGARAKKMIGMDQSPLCEVEQSVGCFASSRRSLLKYAVHHTINYRAAKGRGCRGKYILRYLVQPCYIQARMSED